MQRVDLLTFGSNYKIESSPEISIVAKQTNRKWNLRCRHLGQGRFCAKFGTFLDFKSMGTEHEVYNLDLKQFTVSSGLQFRVWKGRSCFSNFPAMAAMTGDSSVAPPASRGFEQKAERRRSFVYLEDFGFVRGEGTFLKMMQVEICCFTLR